MCTASTGPTRMGSDTLDDGLLGAALEAAKSRLEALDEEITALIAARDRSRREVQLLAQLITVRSGEDASPDKGGDPPARLRSAARPHPAVQETIIQLERAAKPLHISELMRLLEEAGVEVPGAGTQANLIAHLRRHPQVVRPSRGMYALKGWGLEDAPPVKRAARRRVKGPSRKES
jgi:hypothetical protein